MNKYWVACALVLALLAGCSNETKRRFGEALIADRSPITFEVNAVRPIFNCANSPDPRYPCQGMGPEGFVRDLVAKPFANKRVIDIIDLDQKKSSRIKWTWFSMQGNCRGGERAILQLSGGRSFGKGGSIDSKYEIGLTRLSAQNLDERWRLKHGESAGPAWPPQALCNADHIDLAAGTPFRAALYIYAPEPADKARIADRSWVHAPKHSKFETGCHAEKRNGLTWNVCLSAGQEWPGGPHGFRETQLERWSAYLGDSGFLISIEGTYTEPLYLWPQWYAERRAALREVIDSVRFENLPVPYDLSQPAPVNSSPHQK